MFVLWVFKLRVRLKQFSNFVFCTKIISDVPVQLHVFSPIKFIFYRFALDLLQIILVRVYPINVSGRPSPQLPFHQRT